MPRSRNIKPGFFANEHLAQCSHSARLVFVGLWTLADRAGRLEDRPKKIALSLFPSERVDMPAMLSELEAQRESDGSPALIQRYEVKGTKYLQVMNFAKHQSPHVREPESEVPAPDKHQTGTR